MQEKNNIDVNDLFGDFDSSIEVPEINEEVIDNNEDEYTDNNEEYVDTQSFYKSRIHNFKEKRANIIKGGVNCIPFDSLPRFKKELPGIEQAKYYLLTGNEKSGKSQISDFLFFIIPLFYAYYNPEKVRIKILYFTLEMSISEKFDQLICYCLYRFSKGKIRIDTKQLNSLNEDLPLSAEVLKILESKEYQDFFDFLEDNVIYYMDVSNPTGMFKLCEEFAQARGEFSYKQVKWKTENGYENRKVKDKFIKNDPQEYWIGITDHASLISTEKGCETLRDAIGKFSSKAIIKLRNLYGYTWAMVQQQSGAKQGDEAFKLNRITPSTDGLADNKMTAKDCNVMLTIFSPFRFEKSTWNGYNISTFKDNIRFLEVYLNRNGSSGAVCPLYFDGAVNYFTELPPPNSNDLRRFETLAKSVQLWQNRS